MLMIVDACSETSLGPADVRALYIQFISGELLTISNRDCDIGMVDFMPALDAVGNLPLRVTDDEFFRAISYCLGLADKVLELQYVFSLVFFHGSVERTM
jgi:hypothetical protein